MLYKIISLCSFAIRPDSHTTSFLPTVYILPHTHCRVRKKYSLRIITDGHSDNPSSSKLLPMIDCLYLHARRYFLSLQLRGICLPACLAKSLSKLRHLLTKSNSHNTACSDSPTPVRKVKKLMWLHESFLARALATSPPNTLLGETTIFFSSVDVHLHRQDTVCFRVEPSIIRSYENHLHPEIDSVCRWCEEKFADSLLYFPAC